MQTNGEKFGSPQCLDIKPMLPALAHVGQATGVLGLHLTWRQDSGDSPKKTDRTQESKCSIWMNACTCRPQRTNHVTHSTCPRLHSTLHAVHFTLQTPHSPLQTSQCTLYTHSLHFTVYTPHSTFCTLHSHLNTPCSTLHTLQTLHSTALTQSPLSPHSTVSSL